MDVLDIAHEDYKVTGISGRYVLPIQVEEFLSANANSIQIQELGKSVEGRSIQIAEIGSGDKKILMWSQMHGNESTTTKAGLDMLAFLTSKNPLAALILKKCRIRIIAMLNPDGALRYTRENANGVDLNRDALERTQPESRILRKAYEDFTPHYCFNLHDQRTIYNVGVSDAPATLSFLAPSRDLERTIDASREISMKIIASINQMLQQVIPGQIGRYDDAFNANCIGDSLQMAGTPSILFEAGHYPEDYQREKVRAYVFHSLIAAVHTIADEAYVNYELQAYFAIPENNKLYFDILIRNYQGENEKGALEDIGILYKEVLLDGKINFEPYIQERGNLSAYLGHKTYDFTAQEDRDFLLNSSLSSTLNI